MLVKCKFTFEPFDGKLDDVEDELFDDPLRVDRVIVASIPAEDWKNGSLSLRVSDGGGGPLVPLVRVPTPELTDKLDPKPKLDEVRVNWDEAGDT